MVCLSTLIHYIKIFDKIQMLISIKRKLYQYIYIKWNRCPNGQTPSTFVKKYCIYSFKSNNRISCIYACLYVCLDWINSHNMRI